MNTKFYCYSYRLKCFLTSLKIKYMSEGENTNNAMHYWVYEKSEKLDAAIELYNSVKHKFS